MLIAWSRTGHRFQSTNDRCRICVDLDNPRAGVGLELRSGAHAWTPAAAVFALSELPSTNALTDFYARQNSLYASYAESSEYPLATHLSWRLFPDNLLEPDLARSDWLVLEFLLSTQTSLLDATPQTQVQSTLLDRTAEVIPLSLDAASPLSDRSPFEQIESLRSGYLIRFRESAMLIAVHPSDVLSLFAGECDSDQGNPVLGMNLRLNQMEKGVIRRARMLLGVGPADGEQSLREMAESFRKSEAPLSI